ncbi:MAG: flexitail domain-containing putative surface protein [Dehalococcoidia bacterium]
MHRPSVDNSWNGEVRAAQRGVVVYAQMNVAGGSSSACPGRPVGYGNLVVLEHHIKGVRYTTRYAHLSTFNVRVGEQVPQGYLVGTYGDTGCTFSATGDARHLHFELRKGGAFCPPHPTACPSVFSGSELDITGLSGITSVGSPSGGGDATGAPLAASGQLNQTRIVVASDPNAKHADREFAEHGDTVNFTIEFENEGEGIAFGVNVVDTLDQDLDVSTLLLPEGEGGIYDAATRTIAWDLGEVGPGEGGELHFIANVHGDAECGDEVMNSATVNFPSVPEVTTTNGVSVVVIGSGCDLDSDTLPDLIDNCSIMSNGPAQAAIPGVGNQTDSDSDGDGDACDNDDDNDGMLDASEVFYSCMDRVVADASLDYDGDDLANAAEMSLWKTFGLSTDPCDADTDSDGCLDGREVLTQAGTQVSGGRRDPLYFWDYFDVPTGLPPTRDGAVSAGDVAGVVARFGSNDDAPGTFDRGSDPLSAPQAPVQPSGARANYHPVYDRTGVTPGGETWDLLPPNGSITSGDLAAVVAQFGHSCI